MSRRNRFKEVIAHLPRVKVIDPQGLEAPGAVVINHHWKVSVLIAAHPDPIVLPKDGSMNEAGYRLAEEYDG